MNKLAVIILCYNHGKYLPRSIESAINQNSSDYEIIIVNDGSTDNTQQIAESYAQKYEKISVIRQDNGGLSSARNTGIRNTQSEYILLLDADDWISSTYVSEAIAYMDAHPECYVFMPKVQWHDACNGTTGIYSEYSSYRNALLYGQNAHNVFRKSHCIAVGGFDESMRKGIEDWEFFVRYLYKDKNVYLSPSIQYHYQINASEGSLSQSAGKNFQDIYSYIYYKNFKIYNEMFGNPIEFIRYKESHSWSDRKLGQFVRKILLCKQHLFDFINSFH